MSEHPSPVANIISKDPEGIDRQELKILCSVYRQYYDSEEADDSEYNVGTLSGDTRVSILETIANVSNSYDGPEPGLEVSVLLAGLEDNDSSVRESAAEAIGTIVGMSDYASARNLSPALESVRADAIGDLKNTFTDEKLAVRVSAILAIGKIGRGTRLSPAFREIIAPLMTALTAGRQDVREAAAEAIEAISSRNSSFLQENVETLISVLNDDSAAVSGSVAMALGRIGTDNPSASLTGVIGPLCEQLKDEREVSIYQMAPAMGAAKAIGMIGREEPAMVVDAIDSLIKTVRDGPERSAAVSALGQIGESDPEVVQDAVPTLTTVLVDKDSAAAAEALGRIGSEDPDLVSSGIQPLIQTLKADNNSTRTKAATALGKIGGHDPALVTEAIDPLISVVEDTAVNEDEVPLEKKGTRREAIRALGSIGKQDPTLVAEAVEQLTAALNDDEEIAKAATRSLGEIGSANSALVADAVEPMATLLRTESQAEETQWQLVNWDYEVPKAFGEIGPRVLEEKPEIDETLTTLLNETNDTTIQATVGYALVAINTSVRTDVELSEEKIYKQAETSIHLSKEIDPQWGVQTNSGVTASPAVAGNTVYIGTKNNYQSNSAGVFALDADDGTEHWSVEVSGGIHSAPVVVDETLYVGDGDGNIYALDARDGTRQWRFQTDSKEPISLTVVSGTVYAGSYDSYVYALNARDGTQKWRFQTDEGIHSSPTVVDGTVYVGSNDHYIYALDAQDGTQQWRFQTDANVLLPPTVVGGTVFAGSKDHHIYALDAGDGTQQWSFQTDDQVVSSPTVVNGTVYIGSTDSCIYALDIENGTENWHFKTGGEVWTSPAVADETVYIGSRDGSLYALDADDGSQNWRFKTGGKVDTVPTVTEDALYVGSSVGVYALTETDQ